MGKGARSAGAGDFSSVAWNRRGTGAGLEGGQRPPLPQSEEWFCFPDAKGPAADAAGPHMGSLSQPSSHTLRLNWVSRMWVLSRMPASRRVSRVSTEVVWRVMRVEVSPISGSLHS